MGGYDQQLPREDGVDRLAVAVGEAFQGQDLEPGDGSRNKGSDLRFARRATYRGHRSAAVKPGIAVARYSEFAETTSSSSRARTASTDLPSRSARRSRARISRRGMRTQVGQAEELGDGVSDRFHRRFLRPEVLAEGGQLFPTTA